MRMNRPSTVERNGILERAWWILKRGEFGVSVFAFSGLGLKRMERGEVLMAREAMTRAASRVVKRAANCSVVRIGVW